ncbi:3-oxoacyl-[acyl-carrier-protein] reductase FabG [Yarrowia sp. C11]|nr:3-oxoacyl-[acyl-carrier-protein] reductase FabG [Yarrowia sp. C11]KAG5370603.1 3-oxoacyl-[acyl-carrier-protein] reductase FabG [Yarrowia sp. E02]
MGELSDHKAVITGGSGDLGMAIAQLFASHGCTIILLDYNQEALDKCVPLIVNPEGQKHEGHFYDVTDVVRPAIDFTSVDILVNGAGIALGGFLPDMEVELIDKIVATNLTGAIKLTKYALEAWVERNETNPRPKSRGNGVIINIASVQGLRPIIPVLSVYSTTKAALNMFTKAVAVEGGAYSIRSNSVCPGYVPTNMTDGMDVPERPSLVEEEDDQGWVSRDSIAKAVFYLATNLQVSGAILAVDKAMASL